MQVVSYKYKVYSQNRNHEKRLNELMRTTAWIYNHCIALHKRYYRLYHKTLQKFALQSHIAKMKNRCYKQWGLVNSMTAQQITERIYDGYARFFKREAKRPPTFKSWRKYKSVTFKSSGWMLNGNVLTINKLKLRLKFHLSRPIDGKIQTVCVKRDAVGDWWLSFSVKKEIKLEQATPMTGRTAGFDFGLKYFLTQDDGTKIESPLFLFHNLSKLRSESRKLSKKVKGSNGRKKSKLSLARLHRHMANQRNDFQWKLAHRLVSEYDVICLETLNMKAMQKLWGRKISDLSFAFFVEKLSWLCTKYGKKLQQITQWEATSKICSHCGFRMNDMPLNIRKWTCPQCGEVHDRDVNAAKNILRVGTSTLGRDSVSPATQAAADDARIPLLRDGSMSIQRFEWQIYI